MEDRERRRNTENNLKPHPREKTNFLSHLLFCWELLMIANGWRRETAEDGLYAPLKGHESEALGDAIEGLWLKEELSQKKPSLSRVLLRLFGLKYVLLGVICLPAELLFTFLVPTCLLKLLDYHTPNQRRTPPENTHFYAGILGLVCFLRVWFFHNVFFHSCVMGIKARTACSSLIYRRILKLTKPSLEKITVGRIVNLLSNDVARIQEVFTHLHFVWISPLGVIVAVYYVDATLGLAAIAGVSPVLISVFIQIYVSKKLARLRNEIAAETDQRIRLTNDAVCGIQAVKFYAWEDVYSGLIRAARRLEMKIITEANRLRLFHYAIVCHIGKLCTFLCVAAAVLAGHPLTSKYVFAVSIVYETIKIAVIVLMPQALFALAESLTAIQRIQEFLLFDHTSASPFGRNIPRGLIPRSKTKSQAEGVFLKNVDVKWDKSLTSCALQAVSFNATPGELIGVIGRAGSGKSTLLQVILREIPIFGGSVNIEGRVSYASQDPWIFSSSIKQNIIFGESFDPVKYLEVLRVCALQRDTSLFPYGDQTLVGEKGVMLSGGQKARINLARAVYRDADIYLLDDPLSAVDALVAQHILDECILGYLKTKCVILVTHQIHYLKTATRVFQFESGKVVTYGTYDQVIKSEGFAENLKENDAEKRQMTALPQHELQFEMKEHRSFGGTTLKIYKSYCLAAGSCLGTIEVLLFVAINYTFLCLQDVFLALWVEYKEGVIEVPTGHFTDYNLLYGYTVLTITTVIITHITAFIFTKFCERSSRNLHNNMLQKIIHAPMSFFNHNSSGRILNRFSKDVGAIDEALPSWLLSGVTVLFAIAVIFVIIISTNYYLIVPTIVLTIVVICFYVVSQPTHRSTKRTEGITRSTVFAHVAASLHGLATIRASNVENKLIEEFDHYGDLYSSASYTAKATFASLGFWASFMTFLYVATIIFSFSVLNWETTTANVGLSISQSLMLMGLVQYAVKTWGEIDAEMASVERVVEYADLDPELDDGTTIPPEVWPATGNVTFNSVSLKYSIDDRPVLKDISFDVKSGEKIGIVGRTGAGKSSLISVLFRLFHFEGSVIMDGIDTKVVPLSTLRSKISIIPQEPVLFVGSLRKNIDLFNEHADCQIWDALEELGLKEMIRGLPSGLETMVSEGGGNFSVGERQLLCLLRAVLKRNQIIILDEATANVDLKTDRLIQSVIRAKFRGCTVFTIAHRVSTVMDSDKILVLDAGAVAEFDSPDELLKDHSGLFYGYVCKHGTFDSSEL